MLRKLFIKASVYYIHFKRAFVNKVMIRFGFLKGRPTERPSASPGLYSMAFD
jgi:hypothetical protein